MKIREGFSVIYLGFKYYEYYKIKCWIAFIILQVWKDADSTYSRAIYAEHELVAYKDDSQGGKFSLIFMGYKAVDFNSMEDAKKSAAKFCRKVLEALHSSISEDNVVESKPKPITYNEIEP